MIAHGKAGREVKAYCDAAAFRQMLASN